MRPPSARRGGAWCGGPRVRTALLALFLFGSPAWAAEDVFRLDPVFVSVFRAPDRALQERARSVERRLVAALGERHLVVALDEIEPFEDYSAEVYLDSCPADRAAGCAYVIGARGRADWAVSGEVTADADAEGALVIDTSIVDVREARVVVRFQVHLEDEDPAIAYADAVADLIDRLSAEGSDPDDVRGPGEDPGEASRRAAEKQAIAASLAAMESELGALEIRSRDEAVRPPRLSAEDVRAMAEQDDAPPWERYDLTPGQYRRMKNAGSDPITWQDRLEGRQGRILIRGALGVSGGPFETEYDARWAVDASQAAVVQVDTYQQVMNGTAWSGNLELGVGLLPWLDLTGTFSSRVSTWRYLLHPETVGDARLPDAPTEASVNTSEWGARVTVAPLPTSSVRPVVGVGVGHWRGAGRDRVVALAVPEVPALDAPRIWLLRAGPGVEVDAMRDLQLFGRLDAVVPLSGGLLQEQASGESVLVHTAEPPGGRGVGLAASVGVQVGLGVF